MDDTVLAAAAAILATAVWFVILYRAYADRVEITTLVLVLVVLGLAVSVNLASAGVPVPGVWGQLISGILLMVLWGRHVTTGGS